MFLEEFLNDTSAQKKYFGQKVAYSACPFGLNDIIKDDIKDFNIVDVRNYEDYIDGHIPFAVHIPIDEFEEHSNSSPFSFQIQKVHMPHTFEILQEKAFQL